MCVCSVKEMQVEEYNKTQMWCEVPFHLPKNVEVVWRFAEEVRLWSWLREQPWKSDTGSVFASTNSR